MEITETDKGMLDKESFVYNYQDEQKPMLWKSKCKKCRW